jgi:hypothetical protein
VKTFRMCYSYVGRHYRCRVFSASNPSGTFAKLGDLVMDEKDWDCFRDQVGSGWQFLPESFTPPSAGDSPSPASREPQP